MNRRGFLSSILACGVAPAFVGATNPTIWVPQSAIATRPADIIAVNGLGVMKNYCLSFFTKAQDGQWERGIFHTKSMKPPNMLTMEDFKTPPFKDGANVVNWQLEEF